jgi:hypothetical protein
MSQVIQTLIDADTEPIQVRGPVPESSLTDEMLALCMGNPDSPIGISSSFAKSRKLTVLAISNATNVLIIQLQNNAPRNVRVLLEHRLLCRDVGDAYAFDLAPLALSLFMDHGLRINNAVDIQSACHTKGKRDPAVAIAHAVGDSVRTNQRNIRAVFTLESQLWDPNKGVPPLVQRAWISYYVSQINEMEHYFQEVKRVHTTKFTEDVSLPT